MSQKSKWTRKKKRKDSADATLEIRNLTTKTGKVSLGLIKTILGEMKNEFNREVNTLGDDECKQISSTECTDKAEYPIETGHGESKTERKSMKVKSEGFKTQISSSETSNESRDKNKNSRSKNVEENGRNSSGTLYLVTESEIDVNGRPTPLSVTANSKRSLRSHAMAVSAKTEISARVKSSVLRHSKVSPRKCVLQSTFGTLRQDDKNSNTQALINTLLHESSSIIPVEKNKASRTSKNSARLPPLLLKSTRLSQQLAKRANLELNNTVESTSSNEHSASKTNTIDCESDRLGVEKTMRSAVKSVLSSNTQTYTKTGKCRYHPYEGLSYSFTKNNVRTIFPRRHVNNVVNSSSSGTKTCEDQEEKTKVMVVTKKQPTLAMTAQSKQLDYRDHSANSHVVDFPNSAVSGGLNGRPKKAHQNKSRKWKFKSEEED